jgi:hypothetical protein
VIDEALRTRLERHEEQIKQLELDLHGSPDRDVAPADLGDLLYRVDVLERRDELAQANALVAGFSMPQDGKRALVVQQAWSGDEQRRALCSGATGSFTALLEVSAPALERYARRHRWDLVVSREDLAAGRPAPWGKLPLVRSLLVDYDVVAWLDADAIIVDPDSDLADELEPDKDLYLVEHWGGDPYEQRANSGVFMVRAGEWASRLLDDVWRREDLSHHQWWENAALMELLGYDIEASPVRRDEANPWLPRVKFLDLAWNSIPHWSRSDRPRINHHAALPLPRRRLLMLDDLTAATVCRSGNDLAAPVTTREDLPRLFNRLGFIGVGVEVGVRDGGYSAWILHRWAGTRLISVDPWTASPGEDHGDAADVAQRRNDELHIQTVHRLMPFGERSVIWRMTSAEAVRQVPDASLDFVYFDAPHNEVAISEDRTLWEPKLRPGGVLAGRDYFEEHL